MKQGAIFDMDGTLLDTERLYQESWRYLANQYGQEHNPAFPLAVCGSNGEKMIEIIREYYPAVNAEQFMDDCFSRVARIIETSILVKPGAREILAYLKEKGVKLAVASSNSHAQIEKNMRLAGLLDDIDAIVGGDEVQNSKPAPDIFQLAAEQLGLATTDCYAIEDGENGLRAGAAAGCTTVMVVDLTPPTKELQCLCAGVYKNLSGLHDAMAKGLI